MPDQDNQNPSTGSQSDISKAQSQQQPPSQSSQGEKTSGQSGQFETASQSDRERTGGQAQAGQPQSGQDLGTGPDEGLQGDTLTQQRTDVEGAGLSDTSGNETGGEAGSGFVGSQGQKDSSSELVDEEDEDFAKDGQGAPDGQ